MVDKRRLNWSGFLFYSCSLKLLSYFLRCSFPFFKEGVLLARFKDSVLDGDGVLRHLRRINQCLLLRIRWRCRYCHDLVNSNHSIRLHIVIGLFGTRQSIQPKPMHCLKRHGVPSLFWSCIQSVPLGKSMAVWNPSNPRPNSWLIPDT